MNTDDVVKVFECRCVLQCKRLSSRKLRIRRPWIFTCASFLQFKSTNWATKSDNILLRIKWEMEWRYCDCDVSLNITRRGNGPDDQGSEVPSEGGDRMLPHTCVLVFSTAGDNAVNGEIWFAKLMEKPLQSGFACTRASIKLMSELNSMASCSSAADVGCSVAHAIAGHGCATTREMRKQVGVLLRELSFIKIWLSHLDTGENQNRIRISPIFEDLCQLGYRMLSRSW